MVIIINKRGQILCQEDGVKDQQNGGMVNLEGVVIELLSRDKSFCSLSSLFHLKKPPSLKVVMAKWPYHKNRYIC